jgi:hypothetical protein
MRRLLVTLVAAATLSVPAVADPSPALAQVAIQDGLVNVAVGDVTILEDVNVAVAANVAAQICGVEVGPVNVLAEQVDRSGETRTVCTTDQGPVTIEQNT